MIGDPKSATLVHRIQDCKGTLSFLSLNPLCKLLMTFVRFAVQGTDPGPNQDLGCGGGGGEGAWCWILDEGTVSFIHAAPFVADKGQKVQVWIFVSF